MLPIVKSTSHLSVFSLEMLIRMQKILAFNIILHKI